MDGDAIRVYIVIRDRQTGIGIRPRWVHGDGAISRGRAVHVVGEWTRCPATRDVTQYQRRLGHSLSLTSDLCCSTRVYSRSGIQGICLTTVMNGEG
jgi:hypothetical protein